MGASTQRQNPKTTDAEYEQIIEGIVKARIEADKLDLEYLQRFKKILSPKKIYKLQRAEIKFHRDILKIMHQSQKNKSNKRYFQLFPQIYQST